jgi:hypothetical protein
MIRLVSIWLLVKWQKISCPPPAKELEIKKKREAIRDLCYKLYGHYKLNINYLPKSYQ